jgi:hypothetical protein
MAQGDDQRSQLGQALGQQSVAERRRSPVGPADRQRHPPSGASLTHQHQFGSLAVPFEDDGQALTRQGMEGMGDDDRIRSSRRTEPMGSMPRP